MSVYDELRELVRNGMSPEEATDRWLKARPKAEIVALLRPLVLREAVQCQRSLTRRLEREVDRLIQSGDDPVAARAKLIGTTFDLPDGRTVAWLEATAEDHRLRAQWQRKLAGACIADAERHEAAAEQIELAGVTCLRELEAAA